MSVVVEHEGRQLRFFSTHLEGQEGGPGVVQVEQAKELVSMIAAEPLPVVLVGDLNSRGDDTTTPTHRMLLDAGMTDTWLALRPRDPGFTDAQAADLLNPVSQLFQRLDHVLFRGAFEPEAIVRVGTPGSSVRSDSAKSEAVTSPDAHVWHDGARGRWRICRRPRVPATPSA